MTSIGKKIRTLRKNNNITQGDLADKLKVARSTIGMIETNQREPSNDLLTRIADLFNVSTDYLLGRTDDPNTRIIEKHNLPKELINVGYDYIEILKDAKASDLTPEELKDLVDLAKKIKKTTPK
ncbi:MAG: helix-turn-helix transcriptional regulator [Firmicutes bacterium]|nr:helix-turn-helix transcriptional regulator [Bacillota bacterium]